LLLGEKSAPLNNVGGVKHSGQELSPNPVIFSIILRVQEFLYSNSFTYRERHSFPLFSRLSATSEPSAF